MRARAKQNRGIAALEMTMIFPFVLLIVFGAIEYGYWFMIDLVATNAVREGARAATTIPSASGGGTTAGTVIITNYLNGALPSSVASSGTPTCVLNMVGVNAEYRCSVTLVFPRLVGLSLIPMPGGNSKTTTLTATATMRGF